MAPSNDAAAAPLSEAEEMKKDVKATIKKSFSAFPKDPREWGAYISNVETYLIVEAPQREARKLALEAMREEAVDRLREMAREEKSIQTRRLPVDVIAPDGWLRLPKITAGLSAESNLSNRSEQPFDNLSSAADSGAVKGDLFSRSSLADQGDSVGDALLLHDVLRKDNHPTSASIKEGFGRQEPILRPFNVKDLLDAQEIKFKRADTPCELLPRDSGLAPIVSAAIQRDAGEERFFKDAMEIWVKELKDLARTVLSPVDPPPRDAKPDPRSLPRLGPHDYDFKESLESEQVAKQGGGSKKKQKKPTSKAQTSIGDGTEPEADLSKEEAKKQKEREKKKAQKQRQKEKKRAAADAASVCSTAQDAAPTGASHSDQKKAPAGSINSAGKGSDEIIVEVKQVKAIDE